MTRKLAILLSTYNGERYLSQLLDSIYAQTFQDWDLLWRDDASSDNTKRVVQERASERLFPVLVQENTNLGYVKSFIELLRAADENYAYYAFCDQDDYWLHNKIVRACEALDRENANIPTLYCTRQIITDDSLNVLSYSYRPKRRIDFSNAIVQNIVTGCTCVINAAARRLVAPLPYPPPGIAHDWWVYAVVTAMGGKVIYDETPSIYYRQHGNNMVGTTYSLSTRIRGAFNQKYLEKSEAILNLASMLREKLTIDDRNRELIEAVLSLKEKPLLVALQTVVALPVHRQRLFGNLELRIMFLTYLMHRFR